MKYPSINNFNTSIDWRIKAPDSHRSDMVAILPVGYRRIGC
jgi:hypothetical protein